MEVNEKSCMSSKTCFPLQSILNSCVIHLIGQPSVRKLIEGESWLEGVPVLSQPAPGLLARDLHTIHSELVNWCSMQFKALEEA